MQIPTGGLVLLAASPCGAKVIEHQHGWRSEYAAVRSIIKITGDIPFWRKRWLLLELREKYDCAVPMSTEYFTDRGA